VTIVAPSRSAVKALSTRFATVIVTWQRGRFARAGDDEAADHVGETRRR